MAGTTGSWRDNRVGTRSGRHTAGRCLRGGDYGPLASCHSPTSVFATATVSTSPGIVKLCRGARAYVMLDDYQHTGTAPLDLDVDFMVTGALSTSWARGGVAFLYVRRSVIETLEPLVTGWFGRREPFAFALELDWAASARRFECGTPPIPNVYAATAGLELLQSIGFDVVAQRRRIGFARFMDVANARGFTIATPANPARRGPLLCLDHAPESYWRLESRGIMALQRAATDCACPFMAITTTRMSTRSSRRARRTRWIHRAELEKDMADTPEMTRACRTRHATGGRSRRHLHRPRRRQHARIWRHRIQVRPVGEERAGAPVVDERRDDPAGWRRRCAHPRRLRGGCITSNPTWMCAAATPPGGIVATFIDSCRAGTFLPDNPALY